MAPATPSQYTDISAIVPELGPTLKLSGVIREISTEKRLCGH